MRNYTIKPYLLDLLVSVFFFSLSVLNPLPALAYDEEFGEEDEILMILEFVDMRNLTTETSNVSLEPGFSLSPQAGIAKDRLRVLPGTPVENETQPGDRRVELFRGADDERILIVVVHVRYYLLPKEKWQVVNKWGPRYQIRYEPIIVPDGDKWKPLGTATRGAGGLVFTQSSPPNAEGYFRYLEFSVGIGTTFLDSWLVF